MTFTLAESLQFVLAAARIQETIDRELGSLLLAAHDTGTAEAWIAAHDRFNVLGEFEGADSIRAMLDAGGTEPSPS